MAAVRPLGLEAGFMTVVVVVYPHNHNAKEAASQEYELAKLHYWEVMNLLDWTQPGARERFDAAHARRSAARRRYFDLL